MSDSFDASWLALREPVDHRSRAHDLLEPLSDWWTERAGSRVLDLGSGTGSNLRYLAPRLPGARLWTAVDHDARLLAQLRAPSVGDTGHVGATGSGAWEIRPLVGDLAAEGLAEVEHSDLVTASALLDLVSASWLNVLADACAARGCAALFALTYDGVVAWEGTPDDMDAVVRDAVNEHQRRDKGLGSALGPAAPRTAERTFSERGYRTWLRPSAWSLGSADAALAEALIDGWVDAAVELRPRRSTDLSEWGERRKYGVAVGSTRLTVGHQDLLALPDSK